jgi:PAS domain S-box-containing protein
MKKLGLKIEHKGLILVIVPLISQLLLVGVLHYVLEQKEAELEQESRSRINGVLAVNAAKSMLACPGELATYLISKDHSHLEKCQTLIDEGLAEAMALKQSVNVAESGHDPVRRIAELIETLAQEIRKDVHSIENGQSSQVARHLQERHYDDLIHNLELIIDELKAEDVSINAPKADSAEAMNQLKLFVWLGGTLSVLVAIGLAYYFSSEILSRIKVLTENSNRLVAGRSLLPPIRRGSDDEIGHLDRVFREMAEALTVANRKVRAVVDNALDLICSLNKEGKFTSINNASLHLWGYRDDELLGMKMVDLVLPEDQEKTFRSLSPTEKSIKLENRIRHVSGATVEVSWSIHWSKVEQSFFCVGHDVSEEKRLDRMKREFLDMVSHDLRTPLNSISNIFTLLAAGAYGVLTEDGGAMVASAERDIRRLLRLINNMLDFHKMEAGKMQLTCEVVSVDSLVQQAADAVRGVAEQRRIDLKVKAAPALVLADKDRIIQVLVNLLSNAMKFSEKGTTVQVETKLNSSFVIFKVSDQGRGISEDNKKAIFERFQQVNSEDGRHGQGTGLGLAISKSIIELHGGEIGVESELGKGSVFWFSLPLKLVLVG